MNKKFKEERKRLRKKVKDQGAVSRNKKHGGPYTRPLLLMDFEIENACEECLEKGIECEECGPDKEGAD